MAAESEVAISGYLYKRTRDGRWQKRWFETNGMYLTYYKSKKMEKLLAALSLPQVGEIKLVPADQGEEFSDGLFSIELNTRIYTLRARSNAEAENWVRVLNQLRKTGADAVAGVTPLHVEPGTAGAPDSKGSGGEGNNENHGSGQGRTEWVKAGSSCFCCC